MPPSAAQQLLEIICQAVKDIEVDAATQNPGAAPPDPNRPQVAPEDELQVTPTRRAAIRSLKAATHQLLATLMPVGLHIQELHYSYLQTVALNVVVQGKIADLIHSIDPDSTEGGAHIDLIAEKAGMDPRKLSHILRFLALRNVFCELKRDHWANNRFSLPLRTDSNNTQCNFIKHNREQVAIPALNELANVLLDKEGGWAFSWENHHSAFQRHYRPGCSYFDYLAQSPGGHKAETFGKAMVELTNATGTGKAHYKGYDWKKLGNSGTLIDVGGGIGAAAYAISAYLPAWKVVVQDRAEVVKKAQENYHKIHSTANLEFEEADFFKQQPAHRYQEADAYFLRHILHDWPSKSCVQILTLLRRAAKPTSRLLVCETRLEPPIVQQDSPILSNGGMAASLSYSYDLTMLTAFNAEERSTEDFENIFNASGWKLKEVTPLTTVVDRFIFEAVPDPCWDKQ